MRLVDLPPNLSTIPLVFGMQGPSFQSALTQSFFALVSTLLSSSAAAVAADPSAGRQLQCSVLAMLNLVSHLHLVPCHLDLCSPLYLVDKVFPVVRQRP